MEKGIPGIPPTYNRNVWDEEIEGLRWYVSWKEKTFDHDIAGIRYTYGGNERLNYFKTKRAAWDYIAERQKANDYTWYKEPGWEQAVS